MRDDLDSPACRGDRGREVPCAQGALRDLAGDGQRAAPQPMARVIQPLVELGGATYEQPRQQVAPVQRQRIRIPLLVRGAHELDCVTTQRVRRERYLLVADFLQGVLADRPADHMQCLPERRTGMYVVRLRPEHREQPVPSLRTGRTLDGEIREQRQSLRPAQQHFHARRIGPDQVDGAKCSKLSGHSWLRAAVRRPGKHRSARSKARAAFLTARSP